MRKATVKWLPQDTASVLATATCLALTALTAWHLFSERDTLAAEVVRLSRQAGEVRADLGKRVRELGELSPENTDNQKRELAGIGGEIAGAKSREDRLRQDSDAARLNIRDAEKEKHDVAGGKADANRAMFRELAAADRRAEEEGLKTGGPLFDAGPDPTGGHNVLHWYDYGKWKARKALADELNAHLAPFKATLNKIAAQSVELDRKLAEFQKTYQQTNDTLAAVRAGISALENRQAELRAILANPEARRRFLENETRRLTTEAETLQGRARSSGTARTLTFLFHLPMLLWLATLTVRNAVRLLVFRQRLSDVTLDHAH